MSDTPATAAETVNFSFSDYTSEESPYFYVVANAGTMKCPNHNSSFSKLHSWSLSISGVGTVFSSSGSNSGFCSSSGSQPAMTFPKTTATVDLVDYVNNGQIIPNTTYTVTATYDTWVANPAVACLHMPSGSQKTSTVGTFQILMGEDLPEAPTKTGYTFTGWYTDEACTQLYTDDKVYGNITLYAGFRAHTYTINFNSNGGTGSTSSMSMTYDVAKTLTNNGFAKTGYTFQGWATSASGSVSHSNQASVKNLTATDGATVTLYAVWKANTYTIKFDSNGGSGTMSDLSMTYDIAKTLTANTFIRTGYTFKGWATSSTGSVVHADKKSVNNLVTSNNGSITLYAVWEAHDYTIKFNANDGSGTMSDLSMTYDIAKNLTANTFSKTGYTFQGWATSASGNVAHADKASVKNLTATDGGSVTLFAIWKANTYTIKFNSNGGTGTMTDLAMTYDTAKNLTSLGFTRANYHFKGWATSASGNVVYTNGQSVSNLTATANGVVNLYAIWDIDAYVVTFVSEGTTISTQEIAHGSNATLPSSNPTKTGYHFVGWYLADGTQYTNQAITSATTINAKFEVNKYVVTFIVDGEIYERVTVDYGTNLKELLDAKYPALLYNLEDEGDSNF